MRAFVDTEVTKDRLVAALEAHHAADRIVQGQYWSGGRGKKGRGCAVGCTIHDFRKGHEGDHRLYVDLFGVPEVLAHMEDRIFEGLAPEVARDWPLRFARAIPEGADLSRVVPAVLYRTVERRKDALVPLIEQVGKLEIGQAVRDQVVAAIETVRASMDETLAVIAKWRDTGEVDASAADSARSAADSAWYAADSARSAADSARYAADSAWYAADSARSAADSARSAADSAWYAADSAWYAADSARSAADSATVSHAEYAWLADALIEEIGRAPVGIAA